MSLKVPKCINSDVLLARSAARPDSCLLYASAEETLFYSVSSVTRVARQGDRDQRTNGNCKRRVAGERGGPPVLAGIHSNELLTGGHKGYPATSLYNLNRGRQYYMDSRQERDSSQQSHPKYSQKTANSTGHRGRSQETGRALHEPCPEVII